MGMQNNYRLEHDSLGDLEVPIDALYGIQTQRAVNNFQVSGLRPWKAFIWSIGLIKLAAIQVNSDLGLFPSTIRDACLLAAREVVAGRLDDQFVVDPFQAGAGTSHNMNANEVIANRANQLLEKPLGSNFVHPNDHINMSQSTNDVIPTAIRLGCLWRIDELLAAITNLTHALTEKARVFDPVVKSGRTHLQDAVPIRLGQEFSGYARAVERDGDRIKHTVTGLRRLGIGGTAAGTGLNAHPEYHIRMINCLSQLSGIPLTSSDNLFESMQSTADMVDFSSAMRTLAVTLIRIANDFRLLSSGPSTGLDELRLPPVQPGSSIMPGKINPVLAEMLDMAMFHCIGCDTTISLASQAGQLELNVMMPIIAHNLFEMMQIMIGAIKSFTEKCVVGLSANPQKAALWLSKNSIVVTALNPIIGYAAGASLVKEASQKDISIQDLATEKALKKELHHLGNGDAVSVEEINLIFNDLFKLTEGGLFGGGSGV